MLVKCCSNEKFTLLAASANQIKRNEWKSIVVVLGTYSLHKATMAMQIQISKLFYFRFQQKYA